MPMDPNASAPATAAPAAIFFSRIVNPSIACCPAATKERGLPRKRRYGTALTNVPIGSSSHRARPLATAELDQHLSAPAVAVRRDRDGIRRFAYRIAVRDQRGDV